MSPTFLSERDLKSHTDFISDVFGRVENELRQNDYSSHEQMEVNALISKIKDQTALLNNPDCLEHIEVLNQTSQTVAEFIRNITNRVIIYVLLATIITSIDLKKISYRN